MNCNKCGRELIYVDATHCSPYWRHKPYEACEPRHYYNSSSSRRTKPANLQQPIKSQTTAHKKENNLPNTTVEGRHKSNAQQRTLNSLHRDPSPHKQKGALKIPYGLKKDGTLINPSEVCTEGQHRFSPKDVILCPKCKGELVVVNIPGRQKHFQHKHYTCEPDWSNGSSRRVKSKSKRTIGRKSNSHTKTAETRRNSNSRQKRPLGSSSQKQQNEDNVKSNPPNIGNGCLMQVAAILILILILC